MADSGAAVHIDTTPAVNVDIPTPDEAREAWIAKTPRERVLTSINGGKKLIQENSSIFESDEHKKQTAEAAMQFAGGELTAVSSKNLLALRKTLSEIKGLDGNNIDPTAKLYLDQINEFARVMVKNGDQVKVYKIEDLEEAQKLAQDGKELTEEQKKLKDEGLVGFEFPPEPAAEQPANGENAVDKNSPDGFIDAGFKVLEERINKLPEDSKDRKKLVELAQRMKIAHQANGAVGILLKTAVLKEMGRYDYLSEVDGVKLQDVMEASTDKFLEGNEKLVEFLEGKKVSPQEIAKLEENIKNGKTLEVFKQLLDGDGSLVAKLDGLEELFFGGKMSDNAKQKLFDQLSEDEKKEFANFPIGKKELGLGIILLLLLMLKGGAEMVGSAVGGGNR